MNHQTGLADLDGTRLSFEQAGAGEPLVLIHGFTLDQRMWDAQFTFLADHFRVIRYDLRGFGQSSPPNQAYSHAKDLKALLDYLAVEQAYVVGLSMGGGVALDFALLYPDVVTRLVVADSIVDGYGWSVDWDQSVTPIWTSGRGGDIVKAKYLWLTHALFRPAMDNPRSAAPLQQMVTDYSGWHWANQDPGYGLQPPAFERLADISSPTLVIIGDQDLPDFQQIAAILVTKIPRASQITLLGAGHMANMELPEAFNEAVLAFLANKK